MSQTVIGFFDDASDAQTAVKRLESNGISRDRVDVSRGSEGSGTVGYENTSINQDRNKDSESGITRFFKNLFGDDDDEVNRYSSVASRSNSIVTVHAQSEDEAERAADILDDCGAIDVDERSAQYGYSSTRSSEGMGERASISGDSNQTIERIEENLEVGKRTVESGGVRVRSRIVERPVEEHIRLREEHVHVERNPVDRPVSGDAFDRFEEKEIEIRESREVPVVNKEARVVEEIKLSKEVDERDETIRENLRHTEIDVDENINRNNVNPNSLNTDTDDDNDETRLNRGL